MKRNILVPLLLPLLLWGIMPVAAQVVQTGADQVERYLPMLHGRRVALVVNQTSVVTRADGTLCPLPATLLTAGVAVRCIMAPEHGYRGTVEAGRRVHDTVDGASGLTVRSLYGRDKKPRPEWLRDVDVVVFDLQDVGTRFYTYLSTLYYMVEACGEERVDVIVLDRPNPNDTIDGPMRDAAHRSFVGIVPVPLLHGCTLGELAQMMVGQRWVRQAPPSLTVVRCRGWRHGQTYDLPVAPSPNLPNDRAVALYPSLCLFEGTEVSVGRGTDFPFQAYGHPGMAGDFTFTPRPGAANAHPLQEGRTCHGHDLRGDTRRGFSLAFLMDAARQLGDGWVTHPAFFDLLAGTATLREQLAAGMSEAEIRATWQEDLAQYRAMREKYLLYH